MMNIEKKSQLTQTDPRDALRRTHRAVHKAERSQCDKLPTAAMVVGVDNSYDSRRTVATFSESRVWNKVLERNARIVRDTRISIKCNVGLG